MLLYSAIALFHVLVESSEFEFLITRTLINRSPVSPIIAENPLLKLNPWVSYPSNIGGFGILANVVVSPVKSPANLVTVRP